jgi:predicted CXXCH cytochrome family protein
VRNTTHLLFVGWGPAPPSPDAEELVGQGPTLREFALINMSGALFRATVSRLRDCCWTLALLIFALGVCTVAYGDARSGYAGGKVCAGCHEKASSAWQGSHHDLAMKEASAASVLGDFSDARFTAYGVTSRFYKRDGKFYANTDGADGKLADFEIKYSFGWTPLQQYLIELPGGRLQALSIAWDSRPKEQGGQRWFHLYPNEKRIDYKDELHWTAASQNWNYTCAECHSTNLQKNYDFAKDRYNTSWSEINVACEACHGPGAKHVAWAQAGTPRASATTPKDMGLSVDLRANGPWTRTPGKNTASLGAVVTPSSTAQLETCARCHARRVQLHGDYSHGRPLMDTHLPSLLEERLYHPDGQIKDEVYEYGSFLQSKMQRAGVVCSDCHEPHSLKLRASGNALCTRCHAPEKFDNPAHHHHAAGSAGAQCVDCHMPTQTYMLVDPRRDHSLRIPRPDLSIKLGVPNACNQCHRDKDAKWAKGAFAKWWGSKTFSQAHYGEVLYAARQGRSQAPAGLVKLTQDKGLPAIVRATALEQLARYRAPETVQAGIDNLDDADPLVRFATLRVFEFLPPEQRFKAGKSLLTDPVRSVRIEAGRSLAAATRSKLTAEQRQPLDRAVAEYLDTQNFNADRPESFLNMGLLYVDLGEPAKAQAAYQTALTRNPRFAPAYVNLADLYRQQGDDQRAEQVLRAGLMQVSDGADLRHALGLLLVRSQRYDAAVTELGRAARERPDVARYAYVYGVALHSTGKVDEALRTLEAAQRRHPTDRAILEALINMQREAGHADKAQVYTSKLQAL